MKTKTIKIAIIFIAVVFFAGKGFAISDKEMFSEAINAARSGNQEIAFMYYHSILNGAVQSKYEKEALFATGEYYFSEGNYSAAAEMFSEFIVANTKSNARIFALAYLLKIAEQQEKKDFVEEIKKQIIGSQQLSLLFSEFKKIEYLSPLCNKHSALYYIDRVKFYINEDIFEEIDF